MPTGVAFSLLGDNIGALSRQLSRRKCPWREESLAALGPVANTSARHNDRVVSVSVESLLPRAAANSGILGRASKLVNLKPSNRAPIWQLTKERYYQLPVLRDGKNVVFEIDDNSQVIAKYLDDRLQLDLFPHALDGIQDVFWRYIDNDVEAITFKLNDAYFQEFVPKGEQLAYRRHKERKFGRHCLEQWREQENSLRMELKARLSPFEQMLAHPDFP